MASFTTTNVQKFPEGTTVTAYARSNWQTWQLPPSGAPPAGAVAAASAAMTSGSATLSGLADGTRYVAYALVSGEHRYAGFATPPVGSSRVGLLVARGSASAYPAGDPFFATDDNGGTLYITDGVNWLLAGPRGTELGYAEITTQFGVTRTTTDITADVTGLSVTVTVRDRPILVEAGSAYIQHAAVGGAAIATIQRVDNAATVARAQAYSPGTASGQTAFPWSCSRRLALPPGTYTFKVRLSSSFANGLATLDAGTDQPAWIQVTER